MSDEIKSISINYTSGPVEFRVPLKGEWVKSKEKGCWWHVCSNCGHIPPHDACGLEWYSPYCPCCGAEMCGERTRPEDVNLKMYTIGGVTALLP